MKTKIYIGMDNTPVDVTITQKRNKRYQIEYGYFTDVGEIMLRAVKDVIPYGFYGDRYIQYPISGRMICKGEIVSPEVLNRGYSSHYFEIVYV